MAKMRNTSSVTMTVSFFKTDKLKIDGYLDLEVLKLDKVNYWTLDKLDPKADTLDILENIAVEGSSEEASKGYSYKLVKAKIKGFEYEYGMWLTPPAERPRIQIFDRPARLLKIGVLCGDSIFKEPPLDSMLDQDSGEHTQQREQSIATINTPINGEGELETSQVEVPGSANTQRALYVVANEIRWIDLKDSDNIYIYEGEITLGEKCHGVILVTTHGDKVIMKEDIDSIAKRTIGGAKAQETKVKKKTTKKRSRSGKKGKGAKRSKTKSAKSRRKRSRRTRARRTR